MCINALLWCGVRQRGGLRWTRGGDDDVDTGSLDYHAMDSGRSNAQLL